MARGVLTASVIAVLIISVGVSAKRGCSAFGHSCFGGHGKRSDSSLDMASRSRMLVQLARGVKNISSVQAAQLSDSNSQIDILTKDENENAKCSSNTLQTSTEVDKDIAVEYIRPRRKSTSSSGSSSSSSSSSSGPSKYQEYVCVKSGLLERVLPQSSSSELVGRRAGQAETPPQPGYPHPYGVLSPGDDIIPVRDGGAYEREGGARDAVKQKMRNILRYWMDYYRRSRQANDDSYLIETL